MNRADVMRMTANKSGVTIPTAEKVVSGFLESVELALVCGESVQLRRFGKFVPRVRAAVNRRNPQNGELMQVPETTTVGFQPSSNLRARLNRR